MSNPILDFVKLARAARVRSHLRKTDDGYTVVNTHEREIEETPEEPGEDEDAEDRDEEERDPDDQSEVTPKPPMVRVAPVYDQESLLAKKGDELKLWQAWMDGGQKPEDLRPLLKSFSPMLRSKINVYKGRVKMIPDSAIEAEYQIQFANALKSYDPSRGALGTYVYRYLDKAKRFVVSNQNVGRIPENRVYKIKQYQTAKDTLTEELGRDPTLKETSAHLGWTEAEAERMDSELRNDLLTQGFEDDPFAISPSKSEEVIRLFKYELEGQEREVYEYLVGLGRPRMASTGDIARKMKIPDYQVSRIKKNIQKKLQGYLTE